MSSWHSDGERRRSGPSPTVVNCIALRRAPNVPVEEESQVRLSPSLPPSMVSFRPPHGEGASSSRARAGGGGGFALVGLEGGWGLSRDLGVLPMALSESLRSFYRG